MITLWLITILIWFIGMHFIHSYARDEYHSIIISDLIEAMAIIISMILWTSLCVISALIISYFV